MDRLDRLHLVAEACADAENGNLRLRQPDCGHVSGWLILHEAFDRHMQAGSIVIIAAVVLVRTAKVNSGEKPETAGSHLPELESEV